MIIIVTGKIGSGKSSFANYFSKKGYKLIDVDKIGHNALMNKSIKSKIIKEFGKEILTQNKINRTKLGEIVFNNKNKLRILNKITHNYITKKVKQEIKKSKSKKIIVDLALWDKIKVKHDKLILVRASLGNRQKRLKGKKSSYLKKINKFQKEPKKYDYLINNNTSKLELRKKAREIINKLK
ncbi:dephospho-CoA kinase [Nanoarchaeota archaeon]